MRAKELTCVQCSATFTGYPNRKRCDSCRAEIDVRKTTKNWTRACARCGEEFQGYYNKTRCESCAQAHRDDYFATWMATVGLARKLARYGATVEDFNRTLEKQDYRCGICLKTLDFSKSDRTALPCIDHCHDTGQFRGVLCTGCNRGLGLIGDTSDSALRAYLYVSGSRDNILDDVALALIAPTVIW